VHPIHKFDGSWWFWDETWANRWGPFENEEAARAGLRAYATDVLEEYASGKKALSEGAARDVVDLLENGAKALAKIHEHIEAAMRAHRECAAARFRKGLLGPQAFLFATRNPLTGEDFEEVRSLLWLPRHGKVDEELLEEVRLAAPKARAMAWAIIGPAQRTDDEKKVVFMSLQFFTDGRQLSWVAPVECLDDGAERLGPFASGGNAKDLVWLDRLGGAGPGGAG